MLKQMIKYNMLKNTALEGQCYINSFSAMNSLIKTVCQFEKKVVKAGNKTLTMLWYQLRNMLSDPMIRAINILPDYFQNQRNELAENIWNLAIEFYNNKAQNYSRKLITSIAKYLKTTDKIHNLIRNYCDAESRQDIEKEEKKSSISGCIAVLIFFIFMIVLLKVCGHRSSKRNINPYYQNIINQYNYNMKRQDTFNKSFVYDSDSISEILRKLKKDLKHNNLESIRQSNN